MNSASYDMVSRGGILCSPPVFLTAGDQTLKIAHAMDRAPDAVCLRLTNVVADSGWSPGESFFIYPGGGSTQGFYIETKPGLCTGFIYGSSLTCPSQIVNGQSVMTVTSWKVEMICEWKAPLGASL